MIKLWRLELDQLVVILKQEKHWFNINEVSVNYICLLKGWHSVSQTIPFPEFNDGEEEEMYLSMTAPYAARINSILKYSGEEMAVIATPTGKQLQEKLELVSKIEKNIINFNCYYRSIYLRPIKNNC